MAEKHKPIKRCLAFFFSAVILAPLLLTALPPQTAHAVDASSSFQWTGADTIVVTNADGTTFNRAPVNNEGAVSTDFFSGNVTDGSDCTGYSITGLSSGDHWESGDFHSYSKNGNKCKVSSGKHVRLVPMSAGDCEAKTTTSIVCGSDQYLDKSDDGNHEYYLDGHYPPDDPDSDSDCSPRLKQAGSQAGVDLGMNVGQIFTRYRKGDGHSNGRILWKCDDYPAAPKTVSISIPTNLPSYVYVSGSEIKSADGQEDYKQDATNKRLFTRKSDGQCPDTILLSTDPDPTKDTPATFQNNTTGQRGCVPDGPSKAITVGANTNSIGTNPTPPGSTNGDGADKKADPCDSSGWSLSWLVCPILNGINSFLGFVTDRLVDLLEINTNELLVANPSCGATDQKCGLYVVWQQFRLLSNIMFVMIALVIIISQALSLEIISAYTAKKALPRLLIGAIMVQFSWIFCVFMIKLTNELGRDVEGIIYAPFGGTEKLTIGVSSQGAGLAVLLTLAGTIGLAIAGAFAVLTPLFLAMLLAVFTAFFVLVVRQATILLLVCIAPLAFTAFILPHTQKMFKLWWSFFSKALVMYPMILALIAVGRVFGSVITHTNGATTSTNGNSFFYSVVGYIALYAPYFLIPATFKFAGGLIGNLGGMVNDRSRGIIDRSKKKRDAKVASNMEDWKTGTRFKSRNNPLNTMGLAAGAGWRGRYGMTKDRDVVFDSLRAQGLTKKQQDPNWVANQHDDDFARAAGVGNEVAARQSVYNNHMRNYEDKVANGEIEDNATNRQEAINSAKTKADNAVNKVKRTVGFNSASQQAGLQQMLLNKTAFRDAGDVAEMIALASGGSENAQNTMRGTINALSKQLGRHDLSDISTDAISMNSERIYGEGKGRSDFTQATRDEYAREMGNLRTANPAMSEREVQDTAFANVTQRLNAEATLKGVATADPSTLVRDGEKTVKNTATAAKLVYEKGRALSTSTDAGTRARGIQQMEGARRIIMEMQDSAGFATAKNNNVVQQAARELDAADVKAISNEPSMAESIDAATRAARENKRTRDASRMLDPNDPRMMNEPPPDPPGGGH